jgi:hypothetical protein
VARAWKNMHWILFQWSNLGDQNWVFGVINFEIQLLPNIDWFWVKFFFFTWFNTLYTTTSMFTNLDFIHTRVRYSFLNENNHQEYLVLLVVVSTRKIMIYSIFISEVHPMRSFVFCEQLWHPFGINNIWWFFCTQFWHFSKKESWHCLDYLFRTFSPLRLTLFSFSSSHTSSYLKVF